MAAINDLIDRISDPELRRRISDEVTRMQQQKKFGLVFEEHLPEATPLYDVPIRRKSLVAEKDGFFKVFYRVKRIEGETLICETQNDKHEEVCFPKEKMVAVAMFGDPIYPYLKPIDEVQNAPDNKLWHTLIEAENYHALQLLIYLYGGKVDCIYIDPPYNTGDKSWKYNNDYVDSNDSYRHSKWLSMMKKRLLLAKRLLNPADSVLIVTIDEKEYLRLGCLLEELFPEADGDKNDNYKGRVKKQMICSVNKIGGVTRGAEFNRTNEFIYVLFFGKACPSAVVLGDEWLGGVKNTTKKDIRWRELRRTSSGSLRANRPHSFFPIFVSSNGLSIHSIGDPYYGDNYESDIIPPEDTKAIWPLFPDGREGRWQVSKENIIEMRDKGYIRLGNFTKNGMAISYISEGEQKKVERGDYTIVGRREDNSIITDNSDYTPTFIPGTIWQIHSHDATENGTKLLSKFIGKRFEYPKSLYAVHDILRFFVANKPNALVVDFFAGSGTTLHAVNLLNSEDGGSRRCIMVTNNEVSVEEEERLKAAGLLPGMEEWDKWGIARYVNWPRTKCSIIGEDVNGEQLKGYYQTYLKEEKERGRSITQVTLIADPSSLTTKQKQDLVALCCQGKLPKRLVKKDNKFIVSEDHPCSILFDINYRDEWLEELDGQDQVVELFIVTRNDKAFKELKTDIQETLGNIIEEVPVMRPMSEGFPANAKYFKLGFLDKDSVELQRQFRELLPLLWMKAGAIGRCPELEGGEIPEMLLLEDNSMAILTDEEAYVDFRKMMAGREDVKSIFIVTNSEDAFMSMAKPFSWAQCYQLYKDYLENFSINHERR